MEMIIASDNNRYSKIYIYNKKIVLIENDVCNIAPSMEVNRIYTFEEVVRNGHAIGLSNINGSLSFIKAYACYLILKR